MRSRDPTLIIYKKATSAADFSTNWVCSHLVTRRFSCSQDLPAGLFGILYSDVLVVPHVRR